MEAFTVSFFGHRMFYNALEIENRLEQLVRTLLREHAYIEYLAGGRDKEFDQLVSSTIRRCKRNTVAITPHILGQRSSGITKNPSGSITMKSKYAKKQGKPYINIHEQRKKAEYKN